VWEEGGYILWYLCVESIRTAACVGPTCLSNSDLPQERPYRVRAIERERSSLRPLFYRPFVLCVVPVIVGLLVLSLCTFATCTPPVVDSSILYGRATGAITSTQ